MYLASVNFQFDLYLYISDKTQVIENVYVSIE